MANFFEKCFKQNLAVLHNKSLVKIVVANHLFLDRANDLCVAELVEYVKHNQGKMIILSTNIQKESLITLLELSLNKVSMTKNTNEFLLDNDNRLVFFDETVFRDDSVVSDSKSLIKLLKKADCIITKNTRMTVYCNEELISECLASGLLNKKHILIVLPKGKRSNDLVGRCEKQQDNIKVFNFVLPERQK